ncbi:MAG: GNAT family N-acetyltransferase, partial [bacterium]|nr:GNAT family N-acetyltransferase [bacterium]
MPLDLLDACDWSNKLSVFAFLGTSVTGAAQESRDVWMTHCGFPAKEFNQLFLKRPGQRHEECVAAAERWFEAVSLPFVVRFRADCEQACAKALAEAGYEREEEEIPVMVLPSIPESSPVSVEGLEIRRVESPEDLEAFQTTTMKGFGFPGDIGKLFVTSAFHARPDVRLYLGYVDGEPATTSALVATGPVAGIYFVATLEAYRGRGFGEASTWAAACGGRDLGCSFANLQASKMGRPVYERMGFETPVHYVGWS